MTRRILGITFALAAGGAVVGAVTAVLTVLVILAAKAALPAIGLTELRETVRLLAAGMETFCVFDTPNAKIPQTFTAADPCVRSRNGRMVAFVSSSISPGALGPDRAPTSSMSCRRQAECRIITLRLASA